MNRRSFFASAFAAAFPALAKSKRIDWSRIAILTDECASSPEEAIAFAKQYGLKWVELRGVPGGKGGRKEYAFLEEAELRDIAKGFKEAGLKVSFLNTGMLKFSLPDTEPLRRVPETPEQRTARLERDQRRLDNHLTDLKRAMKAAQILGVNQVRVFTFSRVAEPESQYARIAAILNEMGGMAKAEGIRLLLENEASCNVATSAELKKMMDLVPSPAIGINWDPVNAMNRQEATPFPDGYALLQKTRLHNVQMKAHRLVIGPELLNWKGIFEALEKDGYQGNVGLETHVFDGTLIEKAHLSMKEIQRLTGHQG